MKMLLSCFINGRTKKVNMLFGIQVLTCWQRHCRNFIRAYSSVLGRLLRMVFTMMLIREKLSSRKSDLPAIEAKMAELVAKKEAVVRADIAKNDALKMFGDRGETYKCELISELQDGHITTYTQGALRIFVVALT